MPDLVISALGGTTQAARGGQATYTATITNNGPATANNVNLKFMVGSSDWSLVSSSGSTGLAPCLRMFDELKMPALCPSSGGITLSSGQSAQATIVVQIPATATVGMYYAYAIADPYNQVAESNESNNTSTLFGTYVN
jgi:subtilase family serine protease